MNSFREPGRDWDCPRLRRQPTPCVAGARENRSLRLRRVPGTALCPGKLEGRGGVLCMPKAHGRGWEADLSTHRCSTVGARGVHVERDLCSREGGTLRWP